MGFYEASGEELPSMPGMNDILQPGSRGRDEDAGDPARELLRGFRSGQSRRKVDA